MKPQNTDVKLYTAREVAAEVRKSVWTIWKWRRQNLIPCIATDSKGKERYLFTEESIEAIIQKKFKPGSNSTSSMKLYQKLSGRNGDRSEG